MWRGWAGRGRRVCDRVARRVQDDHFVFAGGKPRAGNVQSCLRADAPNAAERVTVQPHRAFGERAGIEKSVIGLIDVERCAIKTRADAIGPGKRKLFWICHRKGINIPTEERFARESDLFGDAFTFLSKNGIEIDAAAILDKDVQPRAIPRHFQGQRILRETAIKLADELAIQVNLSVIVEFVKNEIAIRRDLRAACDKKYSHKPDLDPPC